MKIRYLVPAVILTLAVLVTPVSVSATGPQTSQPTGLQSCTYGYAPSSTGLNGQLCNWIRNLSVGTPLSLLCWQDDYGPGYSNPYEKRYFFVKTVDQFEGYVEESAITNLVSTPHCSSAGVLTQKLAAGNWALKPVGQVNAGADVGQFYSGWSSPWAWAGHCFKLAHFAWKQGTGVDSLRGEYAIDVWNAYVNAGKATVYQSGQYIQPPPYGAMVFWAYGTAGHVGIAVGGDMVVNTHSGGDMKVKRDNLNSRGLTYLGWVPLENMIP
jgi:hypothetical protein